MKNLGNQNYLEDYGWLLEQDNRGQTPLHKICSNKELIGLLDKHVTKEMLTIKDVFNNTPVHYMALGDLIEHLPEKFKTKEIYHNCGENGNTVLQNLARRDQFYLCPKILLNKEIIQHVNEDECNILHYLAENNSLKEVPEDLYEEKDILKEDFLGRRVIDIVLKKFLDDEKMGYQFKEDEQIKIIFKKLTPKNLIEIRNQSNNSQIKNILTTEIKARVSKELAKTKNQIDIG
jgi:hypothetical protein